MQENEQMSEERLCPKCGHRQTGGEECQNCGIIFKRLEERAERQAAQKVGGETRDIPVSTAESGAGGLGRLLMIVLLVAATAGLTWFFTAKPTPGPVQPELSLGQSQNMPASTPDRSQSAPRTQRDTSPALEMPLTESSMPMSDSTRIQQARNATVSVVTPRGQGSGFFILSTYIVTNRHVVEVSDERLTEMRQQLDKLKGQIANERERLRLIRRNLAQSRRSEETEFVARQIPEWEARVAEAEAMYKEGEEQYRLSRNPLTPNDIKIRFADGREEAIYQFKTSDKHDLAVLLVTMPNQNVLKAATERDMLQQGDKVFAIGNPSGLSHTVTAGIFSGYRKLQGEDDIMLQTDAPINPGNSGGPLLDEKGRVHGVNTMIIANTQGIGFAIPIKAVFDDFNLAEP